MGILFRPKKKEEILKKDTPAHRIETGGEVTMPPTGKETKGGVDRGFESPAQRDLVWNNSC